MSDLRGFERTEDVEGRNSNKIIGAVAVIALIGAVGAYAYETNTVKAPPRQVVALANAPSPALQRAMPTQPAAPSQSASAEPSQPAAAPIQDTAPAVQAPRMERHAALQTPRHTVAPTISEKLAPQQTYSAPAADAPVQPTPTQIAPERQAQITPTPSVPELSTQSAPAQATPDTAQPSESEPQQ